MVRPQSTDASSVDTSVTELLREYADVFESPGVVPFRDGTPQCVKLSGDVQPPNLAPFRLSQPQRREVETQVKDLLASCQLICQQQKLQLYELLRF